MPFVGLSLGDIIAISTLAINAARALDECSGAPAEYRQLCRDFEMTSAILNELNDLDLQKAQFGDLQALRVAVCHISDCLANFRDSLAKYKVLSTPGKLGKRRGWKYMVKALQWSLCEKSHIAAYKEDMAGLKTDLNLTLSILKIKLTACH